MQGMQNSMDALSPNLLRSIGLPGVIGGYGGGTWNADGTVATMPGDAQTSSPPARAGMFGRLGKPLSGTDTSAPSPIPTVSTPALGQTEQPRVSWIDGGKFTWKDGLALTLGALGDALSGQPIAATRINNAFQQQRAIRMAQQKRQNDWEDWVRQAQWERDNPKPVNNDTINDFNWYKGLSAEDRATYQEMRPVYRQGADGQFYRVDTAQQPTGALPTFTQDDWDKAGGSAGNGTGGFHR